MRPARPCGAFASPDSLFCCFAAETPYRAIVGKLEGVACISGLGADNGGEYADILELFACMCAFFKDLRNLRMIAVGQEKKTSG